MSYASSLSSRRVLDVMPNVFHLRNKFLSFTHSLLNGVDLDDPLTGLRVVRQEIVNNWHPKSKGFDIEVELNHLWRIKDTT